MARIDALGRRLGGAKRQVRLRLILCVLGLTMVAFAATLVVTFRQSMAYVDELDRANDRKLVANFVERAGTGSIAQQKVQLTWDESFKATVLRRDIVWADRNIGQVMWSNFNYDHMFLLSPEGDLIRAWNEGQPAGGEDFAPLRAQVRAGLAEIERGGHILGRPAEFRRIGDTTWPFDAAGAPLPRWTSMLVDYQGKPGLLTISSILPDRDYGLLKARPGNLVSIRFFDAGFLARVSRGLLLDDMRFSASPPPDDDGLNSFAIVGSQGERLGWLVWKSVPRSALVRARVVPLFVVFLLCMVAMLAGAVAVIRALLTTTRELRASETQAHHNALHDAMTGLPNRAQFLQKLKEKLERRAVRGGDEDDLGIVAYFDPDHFKMINDTPGHHVGDELICQVAQRVRDRLGDGDVLARLGGDEFVLLRSARRSSPSARELGADIVRLCSEPFQVFGHSITVSASCGISWAPDHSTDPGELLRNADIALYRAKHRGRGRWRAFTPEMEDSVRWRHELESELREAVEQDQLHMVYQPIVAIDSGRIVSCEALLRWSHPQRGEIGPGVFVPVAEQSGLMEVLGAWVIGRVFADSRGWAGPGVSINLSPLQLMSRGFIAQLRGLVERHGIDPRRYTFEVTEGILLDRSDRVLAVLAELRTMGFSVVLDDFGIGFSSLGYLRTFKFDGIKVDRLFVQNIENDLDGHAILRAISALGRDLQMKIVAEGVETALQRDLVRAAGCDLIQGHYYWRALDVATLERALADGTGESEAGEGGAGRMAWAG